MNTREEKNEHLEIMKNRIRRELRRILSSGDGWMSKTELIGELCEETAARRETVRNLTLVAIVEDRMIGVHTVTLDLVYPILVAMKNPKTALEAKEPAPIDSAWNQDSNPAGKFLQLLKNTHPDHHKWSSVNGYLVLDLTNADEQSHRRIMACVWDLIRKGQSVDEYAGTVRFHLDLAKSYFDRIKKEDAIAFTRGYVAVPFYELGKALHARNEANNR